MIEEINKIQYPNDILEFMKKNIQYGWLDKNGNEHINNMKNFRKEYRTSSIQQVLEHKMGICIEQVFLMKNLFEKISVESHMYCTRIYEDSSHYDLEADEHMHCFILFNENNKIYHMEHPNFTRVGIYKYNSKEEAIESINKFYTILSGGISRPVTEFYNVEPNLSFKEFNLYINSLDEKKLVLK